MNVLYRLLPALLFLLVGCFTTTKNATIVPFSREQANALLAKARAPQVFGLTAYTSDAGPVFAGAHRVHQGDVARLNFLGDKTSTAPIVMLDGRGKLNMPALLDTCARDSWVTAAGGAQLSVTLLSGPPPYQAVAAHVYDEIGGAAGVAQKVVLEESHIENVIFYLRLAQGPLGPLARWLNDPAPAAVLGSSFLRAFSFVQVDYPQRKTVFASSTRFIPPPADTLVAKLPLKEILGVPAVDGALDGDPVTVLLDTAGDYDLVMNEPPSDTIRRLSIGDLVFPPDVKVVSSMDQGLGPISYPRVGRRLLARYKITFDFKGKSVFFERPALAEADRKSLLGN